MDSHFIDHFRTLSYDGAPLGERDPKDVHIIPQEEFYEQIFGHNDEKYDGYAILHHGGIGNEQHNLSGSCHELVVRYKGELKRIIIDIGGYQGTGKLERNIRTICNRVDAVIFTHPHLDHIGDALELLKTTHQPNVIFASPGTIAGMQISLTDSVKIAWIDYRAAVRKREELLKRISNAKKIVTEHEKPPKKKVVRNTRNGNRMTETEPDREGYLETFHQAKKFLAEQKIDNTDRRWREKYPKIEEPEFTEEDVIVLISKITPLTIQEGWKKVAPGVDVRFYNAGHVLGSVSPLFRVKNGKTHKGVLFSGDLGSYDLPMHINGLPIPPNNFAIDTVVTESTYGGKERPPFSETLKNYEATIQHQLKQYDRIIHPVFALDRLQLMLFYIIDMKKRGLIDPKVQIYVDSVSGSNYIIPYIKQAKNGDHKGIPPRHPNIRNRLSKNYEATDRENRARFTEYLNPINGEYKILTRDDRELVKERNEQQIILTCSGMLEGGPAMWYFQNYAEDPNAVFNFPGYLVEHTLGNDLAIQQKKRIITPEGNELLIQARMKHIPGISGHGDERDLITWLTSMRLRKDTVIDIVHGNRDGTSPAFRNTLRRKDIAHPGSVITPDIGVGVIRHFK